MKDEDTSDQYVVKFDAIMETHRQFAQCAHDEYCGTHCNPATCVSDSLKPLREFREELVLLVEDKNNLRTQVLLLVAKIAELVDAIEEVANSVGPKVKT